MFFFSESQNFHLHLSQSQPVSVLQEEDAEHGNFDCNHLTFTILEEH